MKHYIHKRTTLLAGILIFINAATYSQAADSVMLNSPDKAIEFLLKLDKQGVPLYDLTFQKQSVIQNSQLGFDFEQDDWLDKVSIKSTSRSQKNSTIDLLYGERDAIPDSYHELSIDLVEAAAPHRLCQLIVRAYNEGLAFRYVFPKQDHLKSINIIKEKTQFRFSDNFKAWEEHGTEGDYLITPIQSIKPKCETPLTVELKSGGPYACVMEADVYDYPRMWLSPDTSAPNSLIASLGSEATGLTPFETPWRVVMLASHAGALVEQNYLLMNLNAPCAIDDASWIKPGTVMRCIRLNTEDGKAYIDFAQKHNIDYIHLDAGWYGKERDPSSDPRVPIDAIDLPYLIQYAKERGVGITVYVNRIALDKYSDEIFPLYEKWGLKGVKFGFVAVGPQSKMKWLKDAVAKAAEHHLIVDIHDSYRPTGLSRTYPNLLTQEGIKGNENMPTATHNTTLPFTRYPAGAGDYTICYYNDRIKNTHAHQLAASVVMYSPMQFLFWYDHPSYYQGEPEIELLDNLPVVWDESRVIAGEIGEYIIMARRSGDEWFVAGLTNVNQRKMDVTLDFLDADNDYKASVYADDLKSDSRTKVKIERSAVKQGSTFSFDVPGTGGFVIRCVPVK